MRCELEIFAKEVETERRETIDSVEFWSTLPCTIEDMAAGVDIVLRMPEVLSALPSTVVPLECS